MSCLVQTVSFFDSNNWSIIFNDVISGIKIPTEELLNVLQNDGSPVGYQVCVSVLIFIAYLLRCMLYGTTNLFLVLFILECQVKEMMCLKSSDVILRFFVFYIPIIKILQQGTFASYEFVERAVLLKNLRKDSAELLEALLILSCKLKTNMLNKQHETRRLQSLNIEAEDFAERVFFIYLFCKIFKI